MLRTRLIAGSTAGFVLGALFATVMTITHSMEVLVEPLRVDPDRPAPVTLRLPPVHTVQPGSPGHRGVTVVEAMVPRGEVVSDPTLARAVRYFERDRRPPTTTTLLGLWALYFLIAFMLIRYLKLFDASRGELLRTQAGLLLLITVVALAAKALLLLTSLPPYLVPVGMVPLWVTLYLDRRTALISSLALSVLCASLLYFSLPLLAVYLAATLAATATFRRRKRLSAIVAAGSLGGFVAALVLMCIEVSVGGGLNVRTDLALGPHSVLLTTMAGGILAGLLGLLLHRFAISALGAVSRTRLLELTDLDQPLLKKMANEAPGSWEHSRAMANLAEGAAQAIGANSLLTRVGAYYHDLGKTVQSKYFVENLEPGERSPHEELEPDVSADAIMAHVVAGTEILREGNIPEPVVEFAYTHHGTSVIEYFWHKCLEQGNPKGLTETSFRYPGMRPRTKETAILMLVDSIEAAARTVEEPTREKFQAIVQRVLFVKMRQGQLDEAGLTLEDLRVLITTLTDTLCSVYHARIKYPWQDREDEGGEALPVPGVATEEELARRRQEDPR